MLRKDHIEAQAKFLDGCRIDDADFLHTVFCAQAEGTVILYFDPLSGRVCTEGYDTDSLHTGLSSAEEKGAYLLNGKLLTLFYDESRVDFGEFEDLLKKHYLDGVLHKFTLLYREDGVKYFLTNLPHSSFQFVAKYGHARGEGILVDALDLLGVRGIGDLKGAE